MLDLMQLRTSPFLDPFDPLVDPFGAGFEIRPEDLPEEAATLLRERQDELGDSIDNPEDLRRFVSMLEQMGLAKPGLELPDDPMEVGPNELLQAFIDWIGEGGDIDKPRQRPQILGNLGNRSYQRMAHAPQGFSSGTGTQTGGATNGGGNGQISSAPREANGPVNRSTEGMSEAEKFDHYQQIIESNGGQMEDGRNVVSVRNPTDADTNGGEGAYDDVTAVLWTDADGTKHCQEFRSNTEPSARYRGEMGQDANGDGALDQGSLQPGTYRYSPTTFKGRPAFRMNGDSQVDRDVNQDGIFGNDGGATTGGGNSMLFHSGGTNSTGSAGCQTMAPGEYDAFLAAVGGNSFTYTLVQTA